jgi:NADH:ubiquinone oxidoreductase subunit E
MAWNLEEAVQYYRRQGAPGDQSALVSLLKEVQQHHGSVPGHLLPELARELGTKESFLIAVIRRIPSLRLGDTHVLELCAGPNCGKHTALADLAQKLAGNNVTVKFVPCMRLCGKGPNLRWDGTLHHKADEALLRKLLGGK